MKIKYQTMLNITKREENWQQISKQFVHGVGEAFRTQIIPIGKFKPFLRFMTTKIVFRETQQRLCSRPEFEGCDTACTVIAAATSCFVASTLSNTYKLMNSGQKTNIAKIMFSLNRHDLSKGVGKLLLVIPKLAVSYWWGAKREWNVD